MYLPRDLEGFHTRNKSSLQSQLQSYLGKLRYFLNCESKLEIFNRALQMVVQRCFPIAILSNHDLDFLCVRLDLDQNTILEAELMLPYKHFRPLPLINHSLSAFTSCTMHAYTNNKPRSPCLNDRFHVHVAETRPRRIAITNCSLISCVEGR